MAVNKQYIRRHQSPSIPNWVRPRFIDFHLLTMTGTYEYPEHQHSEYEVIVIQDGPYLCRLNQAEIRVPTGHALVIKPGDSHQDHLRDGQRHYVLHLTMDQPLLRAGVTPEQQISLTRLDMGCRFFEEMAGEMQREQAFLSNLQDAMLETFFWRLIRHLPKEVLSAAFQAYSKDQDFLRRLYTLFEKHHRADTAVDRIAAELGISCRTLSLRCRGLLNESPAAAFSRYRIEKSAQMLSHTDRPIKAISYELGFDNPFHFSRMFKRFMKVPPARFRSQSE